ncbi:AMP-binding protein [Gynuella sunshinyii]|uniref:Acyl-CoA synthetase (AMP-forming)/AMP-acid ligase II n=1 Tax=Gynuella sunshinyii YC6258 TaxID=1445510 RepID=A0A0C5VSF1_9GAMM|nr:AMP-binding protein [Gynuella sunshinyii]AJQ97146.1 acyl-CoA synthetase (AMP-forming)/AMP-acid ligase II [Gynuella sunshinyii YC6258]
MVASTVVNVCPIALAARQQPQLSWLLMPSETVSFLRFEQSVQKYCQYFSEAGLSNDERVIIPAVKDWHTLAALFALFRLGCVAVPVDPDSPSSRFRSLAKQIDASVCESLPELSASEVVAAQGPDHVDFSRPCLGIFTSGSTGQPKLVLHTLNSLLTNAAAANTMIPMTGTDRTLLSLPLHHIGGIVQALRAMLSRTALVMDGAVDQPDHLRFWSITHVSMVSTQLQRYLAHEVDCPSLKVVWLGGGPCPAPLLEQARKRQLPVWQTYGMTETASHLLTLSPDGRMIVTAGMEIQVSAEQELLMRGSSLFAGYWSAPGIQPARDHEGWFHSGDLVTLSDHHMAVTGRRDNRFISGGKNIQPEEIERHLQQLAEVQRALVVPVPHPEFGQVPFAFVELRDSQVCSAQWQQQTILALKQRLPGYLVPRHYACLPAEAGLKPRRPQLQQQAAELMAGRSVD